MSRQNLIKIALNSLIGLILAVLWLKLINLNQVVNSLKTVQIIYLGSFAIFFVLSTILRSIRLQLLLKNPNLALTELIKLNFLSQFLSFIIPIRAGEIAKSVYLNSQYDLPLGRVVIWILLDRFLDFWSVILLILLTFPLVKVNVPSQFYFLTLTFFLALTLVPLMILISPSRTKKVFNIFKVIFVFPKLQNIYHRIVEQIIDGFALYQKNIFDLPMLIFISVLAILSDALIWFGIFKSLNINLNLMITLFGDLISMLTFLVPAAPGYVGSAEGSGLLVFGAILGVDRNLASAAILINHILFIIALPTTGLISLYLLKFDLKLVWKKLRGKTNK